MRLNVVEQVQLGLSGNFLWNFLRNYQALKLTIKSLFQFQENLNFCRYYTGCDYRYPALLALNVL